VLALIRVVLGITVHRRGPDELPSSPFLLLLMLGASQLIELVALRLANVGEHDTLVMLAATAMDFAFVWAVLALFERRQRFLQTMSAMLAAGVVLDVISALLIAWHQALGASADSVTVPQVLLQLLPVWSVDIGGFLLSRALDRPYALAVVIMLGYVLLSTSLIRTLLFSSSV
jgi:hypothetical protein